MTISQDLDALDAALPALLAQTLTCAAALLSALLAIVASSPFAAPAVLVLAASFGRVVRRYRPFAAEAKRLVAVLHGPVVAHLLETLSGREYAPARPPAFTISRMHMPGVCLFTDNLRLCMHGCTHAGTCAPSPTARTRTRTSSPSSTSLRAHRPSTLACSAGSLSSSSTRAPALPPPRNQCISRVHAYMCMYMCD